MVRKVARWAEKWQIDTFVALAVALLVLTVLKIHFKNGRFSAIMSRQSISEAVEDTCDALLYVLKGYIEIPDTTDDWIRIADEFENLHNFYRCIGAIDGKHIRIKHPPDKGSLYYNYKGSYSIVLVAIVNARKEFIMVDIGCNGRVSDGSVPDFLPDTFEEYPYVFIGDEAFALSSNLMKPYPQKNATKEEEIFNRRLSRARSVVECTFGILTAKFAVFQKAINLSPQRAAKVTPTCCYLHNFLMKKEKLYESTLQTRNDVNLTDVGGNVVRNATSNAKAIRDSFCKYYNKEK